MVAETSPSSDKAEIFHELRRPSVARRPMPLQTVLKPRLTLDVTLVVSVPVQLHRASPYPAYTRMRRFVTEAGVPAMTAMLSVRVYAEVNGPVNVGITCQPEDDCH